MGGALYRAAVSRATELGVVVRLAERREAATQLPRTALTMNDSMIPMTTNTMISSSIVKPETRYRCVVEGLSTDASPKV